MVRLNQEVRAWLPVDEVSSSIEDKPKEPSTEKQETQLRAGTQYTEDDVRTLTKLYRRVSSIPLVKTGTFLPSGNIANIVLENEDWENNDRVQWQQQVDVNASSGSSSLGNFPLALGKRLSFTSPSKKRMMTVVPLAAAGGAAGGEAPDVKIEFSDSYGVTHHFTTQVKKLHKGLAADPLFQNIHWSKDEEEVYYTAETVNVEGPPQGKIWDENKEGPAQSRLPFEVKDNFGERVPNLSSVGLFKISTRTMSVQRLVPKAFLEKYSVFAPVILEEQGIALFCAFRHEPMRLGVAAYNARRCKIFRISLSITPQQQAEEDLLPEDISDLFLEQGGIRSICAMRVNPFNSNLVAVVHALNTDIHGSGCDLSILHVDTMKLVPCVQTPRTGSPVNVDEDFPGLYPFGGSSDLNWVSEQFLLLGSIRRSAYVIYCVNTSLVNTDVQKPKNFTLLSSSFGSWRVLDTFQGKVLATQSATTMPPKVLFLDLEKPNSSPPSWSTVFDAAGPAARPQLSAIVGKFKTEFTPLPDLGNSEVLVHSTSSQRVSEFLSTLVGAGKDDSSATDTAAATTTSSSTTTDPSSKIPSIGFVHGGPHATDVNTFSYGQFFSLCCGYEIVSVNYEGSLGFGQQHCEALPGKCGTLDVNNVKTAFDRMGRTNMEKYDLFITGGSHGGFLCCHLTGQFPDTFKATAMRNPVTNLGAMLDLTDIPDWVVVESGILPLVKASELVPNGAVANPTLPGDWKKDPMKLYDCSPIKYVDNVRVPTMVGIGAGDLRVPPTQGKMWYRALKRNQEGKTPGVDCVKAVKLLEYPGTGHAMDSVHADADFHIQQMLFFDWTLKQQ